MAGRENFEDELDKVVVPMMTKELTMALKHLRNGRTGAEDELVAEM